MKVSVEIISNEVHQRSFQSKEGKTLSFREQDAYLHREGDRYPDRMRISLGERPAWPVGRYTISPSSLTVGRFGQLEFERQVNLVPVAVPAAAAPVSTGSAAPSGGR
jgi:Helix-destabilising protein.